MEKINTDNMSERDRMLYKIARKRVSFRTHFATYIIVNAFLWAIWFFGEARDPHDMVPWPMWSTLGWGVGVAFSYYDAFYGNKVEAIDKEFEKLKRKG